MEAYLIFVCAIKVIVKLRLCALIKPVLES